ncbi:hypothetical protein JHK87_009924 [Glycine soja]|nr:hypothetical protein JHK87_009924 [Glycine soja]
MSAIKVVLQDVEAKANNQQISNWLEELKGVLYDADELSYDLCTEALKRKVMGCNNEVIGREEDKNGLRSYLRHSNVSVTDNACVSHSWDWKIR